MVFRKFSPTPQSVTPSHAISELRRDYANN